jgi:cytochrome c
MGGDRRWVRPAGCVVAAALALALPGTATAVAPPDSRATQFKVLVFTPDTASAGALAIKALGKQHRFTTNFTADPTEFRADRLKQFRTVVFLNTTGAVLADDQKAAFEEYFRSGGGFVGVGSAIETEPGWDFLTDVIGTRATGRTEVQPGTVKVADRGHDASKDLPEYWTRTDAWYNFAANVRGAGHVLATVVELVDARGAFEVQPWGGRLTGITGGTMGSDHPIAWCKDYQGGRSFYSSLGNTAASFGEPGLRSHLAGAIRWAAGVTDPVYSDCGATVLANYQQTKISAPPNLSEPIGFDVLPDGRVIQTDRRGGIRLHDAEANETTVLAQIPVYITNEDGMYGPAIDNDFEQNRWVYLYYSPPTVEDVKLSTGEVVTQTTPAGAAPNTAASYEAWDPYVGYFQLSRFRFVDATAGAPAHLDMASEQQILRVPNNRGACCHVAGDIDFDRHNNLWMVTGDDTPAGGGNSGGFGPFNDMITAAGLFNAPHVDARRSSLNTNDLRGKLLRVKVKGGDISGAEENQLGGAYTVPAGNLFAPGQPNTRPEIYAMGFRNPFRVQVDENDVAYLTDYSPDSQTPAVNRGPAGTGRVEIVRHPANYGWPVCYRTDLEYYRWNFNTSQPLDDPPQKHECGDPDDGPVNDSRWNVEGGPSVEPGLLVTPPITNPDVWYSFTPENRAVDPLGTPCSAYYDGSLPPEERVCPRLFPELGTGGVGPHGAAKYRYDPDDPDETKLPPYFDGAVFFGEFTRDTLREIRLDSQDRVFKINNLLNCGGVGTPAGAAFECDNPMDMQFDGHGHFYLLTYGDGFFNINADAGMYRWDYVKGQRAPRVSLSASPTSGQPPLTVSFSSEGTFDPDPGDSIRFEWDFDGDGTTDSTDPDPTYVYTARGQFTARLTVYDSSGNSAAANTTITVGNTAPTVAVTTPAEGGLFAFGDTIPFTVTVADPEDGAVDCGRVEVTFVLAHDTHGHAEQTVNGCSGVLPTLAEDVSHGGDVWGVISASYTDLGGAGGVPALTTVEQVDIRQKRQEVEFALEQQGTNVANSADIGGGQQRGSLGNGDWIRLNGPFNLVNIDAITFRISSGGAEGDDRGIVEVRQDAVDGPLLDAFTIQGTGGNTTFASRIFPLADPGGKHHLFLVFRPVAGGPGNNFFNLNWVEFAGQGVAG